MNAEYEIAGKTVWAEARNQLFVGQLAVAYVIINRARDPQGRWPRSIQEVCLQPRQFSCWNSEDSQLPRLAKLTDEYNLQLAIFLLALANKFHEDPTKGANHYHTKAVNPAWAQRDKIVATIGDHIFYKL